MAKNSDDADNNSVYNKFNIDPDDIKILQLFQENPSITHVEIAKRINKSQPAIGARVTKLERKHILATQKGVNFKEIKEKMFLLMVDLQAKNPLEILAEIEHCPFIINCFKRSGTNNLTLFLASTSMSKLESIIDKHFRSHPLISHVETSFVVEMLRDYVLPVNWDFIQFESIPCGDTCCQVAKHK
ncbi:MAG: Lrp/AsnC family transcriptional regulator [Promethearchaeota archaeon]